jgi:short-chain Z-isoprenyl diphosphate synthase
MSWANWWNSLQASQLIKRIVPQQLPVHLGMILDGNRRFAKKLGIARKYGHQLGINKFREVLAWCDDLGIKHVTIWVFSSENWDRDPDEIDDITDLFIQEATTQLKTKAFVQKGIRFRAIGDYSKFPKKLQTLLHELEEQTKDCTKLMLNVSIGYGGRQEILHATNKHIAEHPGKEITAEDITINSYLSDQPTPDLIIRTSGEHRHSGFLLWHSPYAEYYFSNVFWPALSKVDLLRALIDYQGRQRRFGK